MKCFRKSFLCKHTKTLQLFCKQTDFHPANPDRNFIFLRIDGRRTVLPRKRAIQNKPPSILIFRLLLILTVFAGLCLANPPLTEAHPHVFIAQRIEVVFDEKGLAGLKLHWQFDEMFAAMIADDYDRNGNGRLEPPEVATVREKAFSYIAEYNYFTFITIDGRPFSVEYIKDFNAVLRDGQLVYNFFIPCHVRATEHFKKIKVATYDPSYYAAIFFAEKGAVTMTAADRYKVTTRIQEDPETTIYYGMIHPWTLFLEFRTQP